MTSDAKGNQQEVAIVVAGQDTVLPEVGLPSGEKTPTPSTPPETYTKEQVEKLVSERHSKLDKRIAELEKVTAKSTKAVELAEKRAADAEAAFVKAQKEKDDADLEAIRDNPDALTQYQIKVRHRERDAELTRRERELIQREAEDEEAKQELLEFKQTKLASEIASKFEGVDPATLTELTDGSAEKMELLAKKLGTLKVKKEEVPGSPEFKPDSGLTSGGARKLTAEQIETMPVETYAQHPSVKERYK